TGAKPAAIELAGISKSFGPVHANKDIDLRIEPGTIHGIIGENGAGKSTTMKMLTGSLLPDAGRAEVRGLAVDGGARAARAAVGYLPEHTPLYGEMRVTRYLGFVGEVYGLGRAARRDAVERVVDACDLDGYTDRRIRTLSKGYRQRVGLAQALLPDPPALVLDEPTSGLDPAEIVRIRDLVVSLAREKTILLSTHVLPEVEEVCRRVLIITGGRLVADGPLEALGEGAGDAVVATIVASEERALELFGAVTGAFSPRVVRRGEQGRLTLTFDVEDRFAAAESIARTAADASVALVELRHEVPTLERVFLDRTRAAREAERARSEDGRP
ncbi:MAG: ATP-binding cassette domain-containing protein, partial [Planctomycetota bacterium]